MSSIHRYRSHLPKAISVRTQTRNAVLSVSHNRLWNMSFCRFIWEYYIRMLWCPKQSNCVNNFDTTNQDSGYCETSLVLEIRKFGDQIHFPQPELDLGEKFDINRHSAIRREGRLGSMVNKTHNSPKLTIFYPSQLLVKTQKSQIQKFPRQSIKTSSLCQSFD